MRTIRLASALLSASALVLTGCAVTGTAVADDSDFTLGYSFTLPGGQTMENSETGVALRFSEILEDSRCPTHLECFWSGQARISIEVTAPQRPPTTVEFNTNPAPGQNVQSVRVDAVTIELTSLDPYPQTPDDGPELADYRATLVVTRA